jgi:hypothetical protein
MKTIYRWLGLSLAVLASIGMVLIPASPVDAAAGANGRQVTVRTYNVVVASFRNDPAMYRQLTAKIARLKPDQYRKLLRATYVYEAGVKKKAVKRVSDSGQMSEFSAQAKAAEKARPRIVVTSSSFWQQLETFFKGLQGLLPLAILFFPAAAVATPIVVFILVVITAIASIARGWEAYQQR